MHCVKTIQVRNVPDELHRELHGRAARAGVSLSDYVLGELARVAERPAISDVLRGAASRSGGAHTAAVVDAVRSGRDRD
jgi:antitoxin FitA